MIDAIIWICHLVEALMFMAAGALLMHGGRKRNLDREAIAVQRSEDARLTDHQRTSERVFNQLARNYTRLMDEQRRTTLVCERLTEDITRLTAENDKLHGRLSQTAWALNAWGAKTERGQA